MRAPVNSNPLGSTGTARHTGKVLLAITERPLTPDERAAEEKRLPWRLFRARRAKAEEALRLATVQVIDFDIVRYWDVTECTPGCCPNSWLFEVAPDRFVWTESWSRFNFKAEGWPGRHMHIEFVPGAKPVVVHVTSSGEPQPPEPTSVSDLLCGGVPSAECAVITHVELPQEFVSLVLSAR